MTRATLAFADQTAPTAAAIARGDVSATDALARSLEAIDRHESSVHAWIHLDRDGARRRAAALDASAVRGALHGVPIGFKDNIDTFDMPTGYGTPIHAGARPPRDAAVAALARLGGANPLGKTVSTEFAHRAPGPTCNPWNPTHTPGGSSSGSAAAVASGMVPVALGTQTTGSVIRPAAYCGVIGYKPTWGDFNVSGVLANTPSFDTVGVMTRTVADLWLVRAALLDASVSEAPAPALADLHVGICRTPFWDSVSQDMQALVEDAARALEAAGASVFDFHDQDAFDDVEAASRIVSGYEFARTLAHERLTSLAELSPVLRDGRMADGLREHYADYAGAQRRLGEARGQLDRAFHNIDFVLTPAAPGAAPAGLDFTGSADLNMLWTSLHTPAITLPVGRDGAGLPLGLQLACARYADDRLLACAGIVLDTLLG